MGLCEGTSIYMGLLHARTVRHPLVPLCPKGSGQPESLGVPAQDRLGSWKSRRVLEHHRPQTESLGDRQVVCVSYGPFMSNCPCKNLTLSPLPKWDPQPSSLMSSPTPLKILFLGFLSKSGTCCLPEPSSLACNLGNSPILQVSGPEFPLTVPLPCCHAFCSCITSGSWNSICFC